MALPEERIGMAMLILFRGLRRLHTRLALDHIVFAVDQGSWRYGVYPNYKARRKLDRLNADRHEQEESERFLQALNTLIAYLELQTRCTVLRANDVEGDDFVARWIAVHPQDRHLIVSADSDFVQLLAANVEIHDVINQRHITVRGVTDETDQPHAFQVSPKDGKIKVGEVDALFQPEPDWWRKALFIKLIRGDVGDSIFAAYPGVRYESKKLSIRAAWEDRSEQGFDWNNLMCQTWDKLIGVGADGERLVTPVVVRDQYHLNETLIDLTRQPAAVKAVMDATIATAIQRQPSGSVGGGFLQFCKQMDLPSLAKEAEDHVRYLNAPYRGDLANRLAA